MSGLLHQENPRTLHGPSNCTSRHSDFGNHSQSTVCLWFGCITDKPVPQFFLRLLFFKYVYRFGGVANVLTSSDVSKLSLKLFCVILSSLKEDRRASPLLVLTIFLVPRSGFPSFSDLYNSKCGDHISPHLALLALNKYPVVYSTVSSLEQLDFSQIVHPSHLVEPLFPLSLIF